MSTACVSPPTGGWLIFFFSSGGEEGALCITLRHPDPAQDDRAIGRGLAVRAPQRPPAAGCDVALIYPTARCAWGLRAAAGAAEGALPDCQSLRDLLSRADAFRLAVSIGPTFEVAVGVRDPGYDSIQLALITLMGERLTEIHGARRLALEAAGGQ